MTNLTEFGKLLCVDPVLRPLSLVAAMDVDGDGVLVGAHHALDVVLFESAGKLAVRVRAVLETMVYKLILRDTDLLMVLHRSPLIWSMDIRSLACKISFWLAPIRIS